MPKQTTPPADTTPVDAPPEPQQTKGSSNRFFTWVRSLGLVRQPGWIGGVSVGIADRLGIDVLIVRGILVVVAVFGGPALLLYAAAWLILPDANGKIHLEEMLRGRFESPLVGIAILVALSVLPVAPSVWSLGSAYWGTPYWGDSVGRAVWTLIVLALLVGFIVWFSRRARPTAPPTAPTMPSTAGATPSAAATTEQHDGADAAGTATTAVLPMTAATAPNDQIADWREGQAQWKNDHEEFRKQQTTERLAASQAAVAAARAERMASAAAYRDARARTRSNPLYSAALIGVALVAGAVSALALGDGAPDPIQYLEGAAIAVGVLGLGIVVNGAIGRRSGGATAIAILLLIPLALAGIFPQSNSLRYSGDRDLVLHSAGQGTTRIYTQLSGNVTLDLSHYFSSPRPKAAANFSGEEVRVLVGSGNVRVIVPANEYEYVSGTTLSGSLTTLAGTHLGGNGVKSYDRNITPDHDTNQTREARALDVEVNVASGNITFVEAPATKGAAQ